LEGVIEKTVPLIMISAPPAMDTPPEIPEKPDFSKRSTPINSGVIYPIEIAVGMLIGLKIIP
jgi:hypothetical protein